jgi:CubicO group peptidase (beta-lactamase class C family)
MTRNQEPTVGNAPSAEAAPEPGMRLFSGEPQYQNFARIQHLLPVTPLRPAARPFTFPRGEPVDLPREYDHHGTLRPLQALLDSTHTSALLVLQHGTVRFERYWLTGGPEVQWMSMSVAKSFVSALVGIACSEGHIASIEDAITRYVPLLAGTAYDGVSIRHVLQMSSGARWNEDYADPGSEIARMGAASAPGGSFDAFLQTLVCETTPGTLCQYDSADTQALGMLGAAATGRSLAAYMQEKLCEPLGMASPGYWVTDSQGREMAFAGLLLTARDFARIGELYRNGGRWQGAQVVPADYVAASLARGEPHLAPGRPLVGGHAFPFGYGYQWWLPAGDDGEFSAIGVYNQFVYVDPSRGVVIVKLSANPAYGTSHDDADNKDEENLLALRAIARQFPRLPNTG